MNTFDYLNEYYNTHDENTRLSPKRGQVEFLTTIRYIERYLKPHMLTIKNIYSVGIPSILMQSISSVMNFGMNKILIVFSSTAAAVFGAYYKLQSFVFMPVFGLNNGMVPILAYNLGAAKPDRIKKVIKLAVMYACIIMLLGFAAFQLLPTVLLGFFQASDTMLSMGIPALRIISLSFL